MGVRVRVRGKICKIVATFLCASSHGQRTHSARTNSGHLRLCQQPRAAHALRSHQNNAKYYGHFGAGARTPLGPIFSPITVVFAIILILPFISGGKCLLKHFDIYLCWSVQKQRKLKKIGLRCAKLQSSKMLQAWRAAPS